MDLVWFSIFFMDIAPRLSCDQLNSLLSIYNVLFCKCSTALCTPVETLVERFLPVWKIWQPYPGLRLGSADPWICLWPWSGFPGICPQCQPVPEPHHIGVSAVTDKTYWGCSKPKNIKNHCHNCNYPFNNEVITCKKMLWCLLIVITPSVMKWWLVKLLWCLLIVPIQ